MSPRRPQLTVAELLAMPAVGTLLTPRWEIVRYAEPGGRSVWTAKPRRGDASILGPVPSPELLIELIDGRVLADARANVALPAGRPAAEFDDPAAEPLQP